MPHPARDGLPRNVKNKKRKKTQQPGIPCAAPWKPTAIPLAARRAFLPARTWLLTRQFTASEDAENGLFCSISSSFGTSLAKRHEKRRGISASPCMAKITKHGCFSKSQAKDVDNKKPLVPIPASLPRPPAFRPSSRRVLSKNGTTAVASFFQFCLSFKKNRIFSSKK